MKRFAVIAVVFGALLGAPALAPGGGRRPGAGFAPGGGPAPGAGFGPDPGDDRRRLAGHPMRDDAGLALLMLNLSRDQMHSLFADARPPQ
jgi:hypothetical protein